MPNDSRRRRILEATRTLLLEILIAHDCRTDLGANVQMGEAKTFGPDDPRQVLVIRPRQAVVESQQLRVRYMSLAVDVAIVLAPDVEEPWAIVEDGLADIKEALELDTGILIDLLTGGRDNATGMRLVSEESYERQSGSDVSGAVLSYLFHYRETFGAPTA